MKLRLISLFLAGVIISMVVPVLAQTGPTDPAENQLTIRSDGFLFLIRGGFRHLVSPFAMSDEEINAYPESEPYLNGLAPVDGGTVSPPAASPVVPAASPPPVVQPAATPTP
jgi:hypothetical protein